MKKKNLDFIKLVKKKENKEIIVLLVLIILCALVVGFNRIKDSNFIHINGDFQNYNPVRRFFAGQTPFKDFAVYLGAGHLFLISFFHILLGISTTFTNNLFVTNTLTFLCFEFLCFMLAFLILKDRKKALYLTLLMAVINLLRPEIITAIINKDFISGLNIGSDPGVSARLIRMIVACIAAGIIYLIKQMLANSDNAFIKKRANIIIKISIAIVAGFAIPWSNDGGIAAYISISFVYFLLLIKEYKKDIKKITFYVFLYIIISLIVFAILITVITRGNPLSWIKYTLGVSDYQKWYYLFGADKKNINLLQIDFGFYKSLFLFITIFYMVKIFKEKNEKKVFSYALLSIVCLSILLSSYLYQLLSGRPANEVLYLLLFIIIITYVAKYFLESYQNKKILYAIKVAIIACSFSIILSNTFGVLLNNKYRSNNLNYVSGLDGYIKKSWDIESTLKKVGDNKVFAVYSSAIDTSKNSYQPTGVDYIIHVLGDEQRKKYMDVFRKGNFKYVEDISPNKTNSKKWYGWVRNANWFFYREFYKNYKPVFSGDYNVFYEKMTKSEILQNYGFSSKIEVSNEKVENSTSKDSSYIIKVKNKGSIKNGIVDLKISYKSRFKKNFFESLDINRYVTVQDMNESIIYEGAIDKFNIPNSSDEYYIPVTIINGEGTVKINSYPFDNTELFIENVTATGIYDCFKYMQVAEIKDGKLYINNSEINKYNLKNTKQIKQTQTGEIANIMSYEETKKYIIIGIDKDTNVFKTPEYFEAIKEKK